MELRLTLKSGHAVGLSQDPDGCIVLAVHALLDQHGRGRENAYATLTDQEAETLARELFALSGKP